jgi:hypothetical protein
VKRSKFTDEQIGFALEQAELGVSVEEVCRKLRREGHQDNVKRVYRLDREACRCA